MSDLLPGDVSKARERVAAMPARESSEHFYYELVRVSFSGDPAVVLGDSDVSKIRVYIEKYKDDIDLELHRIRTTTITTVIDKVSDWLESN